MTNDLDKQKRISAEYKRLKQLFRDMPKDVITLYEGIIHRAAYMRATLEDYETDIDNNGYVDDYYGYDFVANDPDPMDDHGHGTHVEYFSQSDKVEPYQRERPVARLYNSMNKNYQTIIRQLKEALPDQSEYDEETEELLRFALGGKRFTAKDL